MTSGDVSGPGLVALTRFFRDQVDPRVVRLQISRLAGGRSNLTFHVSDGVGEWVLRRPPEGPVPPTAHDVAREYRIACALADTNIPVARGVALCEDTSVIGAPFSVVEWVSGDVWRAPPDAEKFTDANRRQACEALIDVMASLHLLDPSALNLPIRSDGTGYLDRQLRRWSGQLKRWASRELPDLDRLGRLLTETVPVTRKTGLVHGDYRFDNVILDSSSPGRIRAVLDWELATVGDPLADIATLVAYWHDPELEAVFAHHELTGLRGFLTATEVIERYEAATAMRVEPLGFYLGLAYYRWAIIREGVYARSVQRGEAHSEETAHVARSVSSIAERGLRALTAC
jgi:aminoglycoside phosphotransferase (APT) family kinase protein